MLASYFTIIIRNLFRRPVYSGVNILGLSIGIAIAGITALYLKHELTYDHFHKQADKIFRISGKQSDTWFASLSRPYSDAVYENQFPEIEKTVRVRKWPPKYLRYGDQVFYEGKVLFTDTQSHFFEFFTFTPVQGNLSNALDEPNSVVLTESMASAIFGEKDAIGEDLVFDSLQLKVTAVINDPPSNSQFNFKVLICNDKAMQLASAMNTYCILAPNADKEQLKKKIVSVKVPATEFSVLQECRLIPLKDLHFEGNMTFEMKPAASKLYLLVFALIGSVILMLSCFNFINLSIAVYAQRTKEIAIRKIVGAGRKHISIQFMIESVCVTMIGFPLILLFIQLLLPGFNQFMGIRLQNIFLYNIAGFSLLLSLTLMVGLIAGSYPALVLPRINSLSLFKSGKITGIGSLNLRTVLVALQLTVMIVMLSSSWIIQYQMNFVTNKDLGFERDGVIKLKGAWAVDSLQYSRIKTRLLQHSSITSVSQGFAPGDEDYGFPFKSPESDIVYNDLIAFGTDLDYINTLGLKILKLQEGISLEKTKTVLINETLAKRLGYENPIGQCLIIAPGKKHESVKTINGVFRDFHFFSLHQSVTPMMLTLRPFGSGINENILVKVNTENLSESLRYINRVAREEAPNVPLTTQFMDDSLANLYEKEQKLSFFSAVLLCVTVFLSGMGLVGLSSYVAELKTKEIGIRKVLGANLQNILRLVSAPFLKLAMIAFVIGSFVSYYLMYQWLESFAYRISISWDIYAYTLGSLLILILMTVGSHAVKAAVTDPVKSLRSE